MKLVFCLCLMTLTWLVVPVFAQQEEEAKTEAAPSKATLSDMDQSDNIESDATSISSSIRLRTTAVTGSRELPKVMVIVPWKTAESVEPGQRPLASLVEEALTPLDPDVFRRELDYYTELKTSSDKIERASNDE